MMTLFNCKNTGSLFKSKFAITVFLAVLFLMAGGFAQSAHAAYDVTIGDTTSNGTWDGGNPDVFTPNADGATVSVSDIVSRLAGTSVLINNTSYLDGTGNGDIFVNKAVSWSGDTTLTLDTRRNIEINANITATGDNAGLVLRPAGSETGKYSLSIGAVITLSGATPSLEIEYNPFMVINDVNALQDMNLDLMGKYALGSDINSSETATWNTDAGFEPVGFTTEFTGIFDGLGHTISGLTINRPSDSYVGLFGLATGAAIRNVGLVNGSITGSAAVGGLIGWSVTCSIENSYNSNSVTGNDWYVGGLVGESAAGAATITNSYNTGNVIGTNAVGGLVGESDGTLAIDNSYNTGAVSGSQYVGGLSGYFYSSFNSITKSYNTGAVTSTGGNAGGLVGTDVEGAITYSYNKGAVSGGLYVGGLVGYGYLGAIGDSYNNGGVSGTTYIGGLVGWNYGTITNTYSTGSVSGTDTVGGLVGANDSVISNSYWDVDTSGTFTGIGAGTVTGATGLTTANMKKELSFTGWDFTNIWRIDENATYPVLRAFPDTIAPTVISTSPEKDAVEVAINASLRAVFSETMDPATIDGATFTLSGGVTGEVVYSGTTATFTPSGNLAYATTYTATISTNAKDTAGNAMAAAYSWSFTTQANPDQTPPITTASSAGGIFNATQYVTLSCSDTGGSGCETTYYCFGSGCTAGTVYSGGSITVSSSTDLRYRSVDAAKNGEDVKTLSFTIDVDLPQLTLSTLPDSASTKNPVLNVSGTVSDNTGIQSVTVNGAVVSLYDSQPSVWFTYPIRLKMGSNSVSIIATDYAGNQVSSTRTIQLDSLVPRILLTAPSDMSVVNSPTLTISGLVSDSTTVTVSLNSGPQTAASVASQKFSASVELSPGWNTIDLRASDGTRTATTKRTVIYSDTQPDLSVLAPLQDFWTDQGEVTLSGEATTADSVNVVFEGANYPQTLSGGAFASQTFSLSSQGTYTIAVSATKGSSVSTVVRYVVYDTSPPDFAVNPVISPTNQSSQIITGNVPPGNSVSASCSTANVSSVTYPKVNFWQVTVSSLTEGRNDVILKEKDSTGVTVKETIVTIELDTDPPSVWASPEGNYYATEQSIVLSADETATIYYTTDSTDPTSSLTRETYSSAISIVANTTLMFYAVDRAGNASEVVTEVYTLNAEELITKTSPALKSIITTLEIAYTLVKTVASGSITFSWTGGAADENWPYEYTLQGSQLLAGSHSIPSPGFSLTEGAFYTVTFSAMDAQGNWALPVKNTMVFFDSNYGQGPTGNVENTGSSKNRVDYADVTKMNGAMNTRPGDSSWNPVCDLNKDNVVDQKDLAVLNAHYGEQQ